jgi:hypothetical protein
MGPVFVWSCVEPYVGILCACLPTFAPLVRIAWNKVRGFSANHESGGKPSVPGASNHIKSRSQMQKPSQWNKLGGGPGGDSDSKLRDDDEMELTTEIRGKPDRRSQDSGEDLTFPIHGIMVKSDVQWSSDAVDNKH